MALFGRDYDRDFGYYGGNRNFGYDRPYRSTWNNAGWNEPARSNRGWSDARWGANDRWGGNDRDFGYRGGMNRYEQAPGHGGYDRGYKSRWQTDFGDPFGDRSSRTPMRVIRGEYHPGGERGYYGGERGRMEYDRDFHGSNPMSYDPYTGAGREGTWMRGYDRNYRTHGRGYDTGWF